MKVQLDRSRCASHGECLTEAPELFDMDDDDIAVLLQEHPTEALRGMALRSADACPMAAIRIID